MAKLSSYYTLCPLIDQQNLLGVEKDCNPGCVIVTLGKNIVIRYKLQDLKQLSSWSTKDRLTTQVIYDEIDARYVAVFNEIYLRVWHESASDLDKVKKHKFHSPFHAILRIDNYPPILVCQNGSTASLTWALTNRKSWYSKGVLQKEEKIRDCQLINIGSKMYLCMLTCIDNLHDYIVVPLDGQTYVEDSENLKRIKLQRTAEKLVGHVVIQDTSNAYLLTLWSHGRLYSYSLLGCSANPPPGNLLSVVTALNTKHPIIMTPLNEITIAAYGADIQEEGAILVIYNLSFKLVQAIQKLKLYTKEAKLWRIEDKLLLAANRHLAVAPFSLTPQRIEAMVGSSRLAPNSTVNVNGDDNEIVVIQEMETAIWGSEVTEAVTFSDPMPEEIKVQLSTLVKDGLPEAVILETLIPALIKSRDIRNIIWCLKNFRDVPEKLLINLLSFCLTTSDKSFDSDQNGFTDSCVIEPLGRAVFLNHILSVHYSDICLMSHLKTSLGFTEILSLLDYLTHALDSTQEEHELPQTGTSQPSEEQLLDWASLLLDSHYQQYLLSQDPRICSLLQQLSSVLEVHFHVIDDLQTLRSLVERLRDGKSLGPTPKSASKYYSIEEVKLY
ncbi:nucleolar protein 11 isoform X1 [Neodiprion lecontei]|uniref:Nucleolar protein 11 isoform X1 n=1 Tax=Neodiprion lecontei TaxID=441921 RepID=A0A6J0B783_NEOLC|nr:nucleolar protein 11 isoform X1 [Neodiprion lecontei]